MSVIPNNTPNTPPPTINQAMAVKKGNPVPTIIMAVLGILVLGVALYGYLLQTRTARVVVIARDVPYGQVITAEDLRTIEIRDTDAPQINALGNPATAVGQYASRDLRTGDFVRAATMLMAEPPTQPVYPNGEQLQPNMVPLGFATDTIGPMTAIDRVNIGFNDPSGSPRACNAAIAAAEGGTGAGEIVLVDPNAPALRAAPYACRMLSGVEVLYVADEVAYLELTPYQALAVRALQSAGVTLWGERYGVTSDDLSPLDRLSIEGIAPQPLIAPGIVPGGEGGEIIAPDGSTLPGVNPGIIVDDRTDAEPTPAPTTESDG